MYGLLNIIETDIGCIIHSDIRESGLDRSNLKLRINPKKNIISIVRFDEPLATGTFNKDTIKALKGSQNVVLTFEDFQTGNMESLYLKQS